MSGRAGLPRLEAQRLAAPRRRQPARSRRVERRRRYRTDRIAVPMGAQRGKLLEARSLA
jgi:hypothetical protein